MATGGQEMKAAGFQPRELVKSASKSMSKFFGFFATKLLGPAPRFVLARKILDYMWAQQVWLPTSHYEKIFTVQYLPYRVKFNWWLIVPTTVICYWLIVLRNKYFVDEGKAPNKRKYYTLEPSYYNFIMRAYLARKLKKEHSKATYIV